MADNPQETIQELRTLVVAYVKQETVDPMKGLGRHVGFGLGGAILIGTGALFLGVGLLRLLQGWDPAGNNFTGNWSWVPYIITVVVMGAVAGLFAALARRRKTTKATRTAPAPEKAA